MSLWVLLLFIFHRKNGGLYIAFCGLCNMFRGASFKEPSAFILQPFSFFKCFFSDYEKRFLLVPWLHKEISFKSISLVHSSDKKSRILMLKVLFVQFSLQFLTEPATYFCRGPIWGGCLSFSFIWLVLMSLLVSCFWSLALVQKLFPIKFLG